MEEWKEYKLGDICTKIGSGATPKGGKEAYLGGNTSLIRSQNVLDFSFSWDGLAYIDDEQATKLNGVVIESGDVLLNITGDSVARACVVPESALPARVNQHVSIIRGDSAMVLNDYILYFLQYKKPYLLSLSQGGATRNALTKGMIEALMIPLPSLSKQADIVHVLKSLDDKIEINKQINDNLEQQAQALFKSWFVDFEPFKNGEFIDSELGRIPKGWKVGKLSELIDVKYGKEHKKLIDGNIPVYGSGGLLRKVDRSLYEGESVLIPRKGTLNNVMYVNEPFWTVDTMFYSIPKLPNIVLYTYIMLCEKDLASMNAGSAVPSMTTDILNNMQIIIPNEHVLGIFNSLVFTLYVQIKYNEQESCRLAKLRDTLLPKLMSGELQINK